MTELTYEHYKTLLALAGNNRTQALRIIKDCPHEIQYNDLPEVLRKELNEEIWERAWDYAENNIKQHAQQQYEWLTEELEKYNADLWSIMENWLEEACDELEEELEEA